MNILEAIKEMENGKTVQKGQGLHHKMKITAWADGSDPSWEIFYLVGENNWVPCTFSTNEILSNDWKVIENENSES